MSVLEYLTVIDQFAGMTRIAGEITPRSDWSDHLVQQLKAGGEGWLPLNQQVFPGDRVTIAISSLVPRGSEIADTILAELSESGIDTSSVTVVTNLDPAQHAIPEAWTTHDPNDLSDSSMVGVSRGGEAIYLNQAIADADVVIPVVLAGRGKSPDGYLYPAFSTLETQVRLEHQHEAIVGEAMEAEQMVSPFFVVGVVSAPGDTVGDILVAARPDIELLADRTLAGFWSTGSVQRDAVVATLGPVSRRATIEHLWEALKVASQLVTDHGPIVLVGSVELESEHDAHVEDLEEEIAEHEHELQDQQQDDMEDEDEEEWDEDEADYRHAVELGDSIRHQDRETAEAGLQVDTESPETSEGARDAPIETDSLDKPSPRECLTQLLDELRTRQPVFLVSQLNADQTEELGFGYLGGADDLQRLLGRHQNVGLIDEAHRWRIVS